MQNINCCIKKASLPVGNKSIPTRLRINEQDQNSSIETNHLKSFSINKSITQN